ncbi:hypothetical protein KQI42_01505 [Tissierella sp. MSJ-40]|uniref:UDP-2,4-diacetamido-2,4, 6-trideoxy-beta-L-altropyranose hydrolase n=1 Tax=Tissierella simiarum TaxID=2841534 RepID=A0ABS6E1J4_9FIRM|nr:hypothetical protein [Tissierella simiarum]MBU5436662.1 hypothetical protein [Tissierella simiarum]
MKNVVIRTLGGKGIGYGHFYRCLSLAKAIKRLEKDVNITFIINHELISLISNTEFKFIMSNNLDKDHTIIEKLNISLFIFDSYLGENDYLRKMKEKSKLMLIDDNNDIYDSSIPDIIYNGNIHAGKLRYPDIKGQLKLLGPKYLIMKEEYWDKHNEGTLNKNGILITTGGTDEYKIVLKIIDAIKDLSIKTRIIIGPGYKDNYIKEIENVKTENIELIYKPLSLKEYILSSKIVVTAGGSTVYEILSQKSIPIIFSIANNQDFICKELSDIGIEYLGKHPNIEYHLLDKIIKKIQYDKRYKNDEIFNIVNREGALLVSKILLREI